MIKINLLESVTDKPIGAATVVEKKVASEGLRFYLMAGVVLALTMLVGGWDYLSSTSAKASAEKELANQKQIATQMEAIIKEQADLEQKIKAIDTRIEAIKKLRSTQAGPSAVLAAMRERIEMTPGLYLESVEQKGDQLTIKGNSPDEYAVTRFGSSLEFSNGLFSNLSIETQRKEVEAKQVATSNGQVSTGDTPKPETVNFTIRCAYTPSKATNQATLPNGTTASGQTPNSGAIGAINQNKAATDAAIQNSGQQPQVAQNKQQ
jgi:Tfp pilus assembly protein PilN